MIVEILLLLIAVIILIFIIKLLPSWKSPKSISGLVVNAVSGIVLLLATDFFNLTTIPTNFVTVLVCAIGGVPGSLILIVLNLLQLYP